MDFLDIQAGILPLHLMLQKLCFAATLRIATLPDKHPLHPFVKRVYRYLFLKSHRAPMHNLFEAFQQLLPKNGEIGTIQPIATSPGYVRNFTFDIAPNKKEAIANFSRRREDDIQLFRRQNLTRQLYLGSGDEHTVFEGEVIGATLAIHSIPSQHRIWSIFVGIDNQSLITAMANPKRQSDIKIHLSWIPGHSDVPGNEEVDGEAKRAAEQDSSNPASLPEPFRSSVPRSIAVLKATFNKELQRKWDQEWRTSKQSTRYAKLDNKTPIHNIYKTITELPQSSSTVPSLSNYEQAMHHLKTGFLKLSQLKSIPINAPDVIVKKISIISSSSANDTLNNGLN
ncbi:hypothetical protein C8J56DRAFT_899686 [Mycena floridula]|nr:hypothetical protein C8J56DRAFT_899686 [Mycena floridula]